MNIYDLINSPHWNELDTHCEHHFNGEKEKVIEYRIKYKKINPYGTIFQFMNLNVRSIPTDDPEYSKKLTIEEFKESCNKHLLDLKKEIITISGIFSNRFDHFNSEHISSAAKKEFSEYKIIFNSINNLEILFRFAKLAYLSRRNDDENHGLSAWSTQKVSWSEADLLSLIRQNKLLLKSIQKDYALENFNT